MNMDPGLCIFREAGYLLFRESQQGRGLLFFGLALRQALFQDGLRIKRLSKIKHALLIWANLFFE